MNVERIFFWIRLLAEAVLEVFDRIEGVDGPIGAELKPERVQLWLQILARAALETLDGVGGAQLKPERVQFWLDLGSSFLSAVIAAAPEAESGSAAGGDD